MWRLWPRAHLLLIMIHYHVEFVLLGNQTSYFSVRTYLLPLLKIYSSLIASQLITNLYSQPIDTLLLSAVVLRELGWSNDALSLWSHDITFNWKLIFIRLLLWSQGSDSSYSLQELIDLKLLHALLSHHRTNLIDLSRINLPQRTKVKLNWFNRLVVLRQSSSQYWLTETHDLIIAKELVTHLLVEVLFSEVGKNS